MTIALVVLLATTLLEIALHVGGLWRARRILATAATGGLVFCCTALPTLKLNLFSVLIVIILLYRILNNVRLLENRMHERYLRNAHWRTAWKLLAAQFFLFAVWASWERFSIDNTLLWGGLAALQLVVASLLFASTVRSLKRTRWSPSKIHYSDSQLPTVSVLVPARNETDDLQICLETVIASNYPKLEILVLDDCSQTKCTPEIIRAFAHDGVRFVQGKDPDQTWLPKNQAYDRLVKEASGDYLLFCGVDIRFQPDSIRQLVTAMLSRNKQMMSILPLRDESDRSRYSLLQAVRYWWELVPPRRLFRRPPVLSSCWIITTQALKQAGGFRAVARCITPEAHFARQLIKPDAYSFMRADHTLAIQSVKQPREQRDTAIRTRYPQMHRRPEQVWVTSFAELTFLVLPFGFAIGGHSWHIGPLAQTVATLASILLAASYACVATATRINVKWFSIVALPLVVLADIVVLHESMWRYEFSTVDWKGRNICIPAMHVIPRLPSLPDYPKHRHYSKTG